MVIGEELRDLIFQQIPKDVLRRVAVDLGMRTLKHSAVDKILEGTTTRGGGLPRRLVLNETARTGHGAVPACGWART